MNKVLAVAARELGERWPLVPAGLALGFVPLVLPAFGLRRDLAPLVGLLTALLLGALAAVVIGSSMLARDAANGRLGFLFSRPVPWAAIWGGKWLAALVLVTASGFLAAVPWMAAYPPETHGGSWLASLADPQGPIFFVTLLLLGIGIANFGATAFRSRSGWLALDLLLVLAAAWAVQRYVAPLALLGLLVPEPQHRHLHLALLPLALALVLASVPQVAVGRTDLRRAHRWMSTTFWAVVFLTLAVAAGRLQWALAAGPADLLGSYFVSRDPAGRWIQVTGGTNRGGGWQPTFLLESTTGRFFVPEGPAETRRGWPWGVSFSADGRFAAQWRVAPRERSTALTLVELTHPSSRVTQVALESSPPPTWRTSASLSPSGSAALLVHESGASLFALPSGRRLATATFPPGWLAVASCFLDEGAVRAWLVRGDAAGIPYVEAGVRVLDLGVSGATRSASFVTEAALDPLQQRFRRLTPLAGGRRLLTYDRGVHLRDGANGTLLAKLADDGQAGYTTLLADGRIVLVGAASGRTSLRVFGPAGELQKTIAVDHDPGGLQSGPEVRPGLVALGFGAPFAAGETVLVDVDAGRIVESLTGLRPVAAAFWGLRATAAVPAGGEASRTHFFGDGDGRLLRIDFATGERRIVAGPGAARGERLSSRPDPGSR